MKINCTTPAFLAKWPDLKASWQQECGKLARQRGSNCCGQGNLELLVRKFQEAASKREASARYTASLRARSRR